jgi:hypothetical protein
MVQARRLEQDWRTASSTLGDRRRIIDMTFVTGVDEDGNALITRWHREGAWFIASSAASRALVEAILGEALPEALPYPGDPIVSERTWTPFRTSLRLRTATLVLLATMVFPIEANAATIFRIEAARDAASSGRLKTASAPLKSAVERSSWFRRLDKLQRRPAD